MAKRKPKTECLLPQRTSCAFHGLHHGFYRSFVFGMASELPLVFGGPRTPCCTPLHFFRHRFLLQFPMLIAVFITTRRQLWLDVFLHLMFFLRLDSLSLFERVIANRTQFLKPCLRSGRR